MDQKPLSAQEYANARRAVEARIALHKARFEAAAARGDFETMRKAGGTLYRLRRALARLG
ncbi:hypothetical protein SAMN05216200_11413 [Oceanicella actignis]|uniref:Uncharacterized protein n=1 Tax=Oceanicella actignis TaxID=1189325 RepID=A0A1M7U1L4_9RHOB|nr:hypothetical protein SAMN04488119_101409 [Oceanicella actignis]SHN76866.1 hypothetical protein SAMN05216200_11413 [Oceanicella actignis]